MTSVEVGLAPGSYRIIDLFCFKEVLNQIMKVPHPLPPFLLFPFISSVPANLPMVSVSSNKIQLNLDQAVFTPF